MITYKSFNIFVDIVTAVLLLMIHYSLSVDNDRRVRAKNFNTATVFGVLYCIADVIFQRLNGDIEWSSFVTMLSYMTFFFDYIMSILISAYLMDVSGMKRSRKRRILMLYNLGLDAWCIGLIILVSNGLVFGIDRRGFYERRSFWMFSVLYPLITFLIDLFILLFSKIDKKTKMAFALFSIFISVGIIISYFTVGISSVSVLILCTAFILYMSVYVEKSRGYYIASAELKEKQTESMVSQIQPHFLYNCITTCVALCRIDAEKAAEMMANFGKYLRANLDALKGNKPIPFLDELEHVKVYLELEQVRFADKLKVCYNISVDEFVVPALSIQPIVENAVKHGISTTAEGGTVEISTWEDDRMIYIEIKDNGCGFDTDAAFEEGRSHIGLENVNKRLQLILGATLQIHSIVGTGTTAMITIPKNSVDNEEEDE